MAGLGHARHRARAISPDDDPLTSTSTGARRRRRALRPGSMLGDAGWAEFRTRARAVYAERFSDPLNDFRDVILAVATKPGA